MEIKIIKEKISTEELKKIAERGFGNMIKAVVDIKEKTLSLGGELHADGMEMLIKNGYKPENLWGVNIYPDKPRDEWIEFTALINIRPSLNNRSMEIQSSEIKEKIKNIVNNLIS